MALFLILGLDLSQFLHDKVVKFFVLAVLTLVRESQHLREMQRARPPKSFWSGNCSRSSRRGTRRRSLARSWLGERRRIGGRARSGPKRRGRSGGQRRSGPRGRMRIGGLARSGPKRRGRSGCQRRSCPWESRRNGSQRMSGLPGGLERRSHQRQTVSADWRGQHILLGCAASLTWHWV